LWLEAHQNYEQERKKVKKTGHEWLISYSWIQSI
jgi:hypothetical protein